MVIGLGAVLAVRFLPRRGARRLGWAVAAVGVLGLAGLVALAVGTWEPFYGEATAGLVARRVVYLLATSTLLPAAQCVLGGFVMVFAARGRFADRGVGNE